MKMLKCDPRAFARCPYRKECSDGPEHTSFYKGTECDYFNQQVIHAPLTNADIIRSMTDEELAEYISNEKLGIFIALLNILGIKITPEREQRCFDESKKEIIDWLQKPTKED